MKTIKNFFRRNFNYIKCFFVKPKVRKEVVEEKLDVSIPFCITVKNRTDKVIENVVMLNPNRIIADLIAGRAKEPSYGNPDGIEITYNYSNNNFTQFMLYLLGNFSRIAMIRTNSESSVNLESKITIENSNLQGSYYGKIITPELNAFQTIENRIDTSVDFYLTGNTKIDIAEIQPNSDITFNFYPAFVKSQVAGEGKKYSKPNISGPSFKS